MCRQFHINAVRAAAGYHKIRITDITFNPFHFGKGIYEIRAFACIIKSNRESKANEFRPARKFSRIKNLYANVSLTRSHMAAH